MNKILDEIVELTKVLIRFKTFSHDHEQLDKCTRYMEQYLEKTGIEYTRKDVNNVPSILVTPGKAQFPVLLMSHIDVVDGPDSLFEPRLEDGRLYGRGSIDDKYAVALSLVLLKNRLADEIAAGRGQGELNFGVLITGDEEVGGMDGAARMLEEISPEFSIALDGGSPDMIVTKEKGILRLLLESHGKTGHASRPWMGVNAIDRLFRDYTVIMGHFKSETKDRWHMTASPTVVDGGGTTNQVPDYCRMLFDVRYTETDDVDELVADIGEKIQGNLTVAMKEPVFVTGPTPYLEHLQSVDSQIKTGFEHGASDARHLMRFGRTGVVWGAQGDLSQHSLDEHVDIRSIGLLYERLARFLQKV